MTRGLRLVIDVCTGLAALLIVLGFITLLSEPARFTDVATDEPSMIASTIACYEQRPLRFAAGDVVACRVTDGGYTVELRGVGPMSVPDGYQVPIMRDMTVSHLSVSGGGDGVGVSYRMDVE